MAPQATGRRFNFDAIHPPEWIRWPLIDVLSRTQGVSPRASTTTKFLLLTKNLKNVSGSAEMEADDSIVR